MQPDMLLLARHREFSLVVTEPLSRHNLMLCSLLLCLAARKEVLTQYILYMQA